MGFIGVKVPRASYEKLVAPLEALKVEIPGWRFFAFAVQVDLGLVRIGLKENV